MAESNIYQYSGVIDAVATDTTYFWTLADPMKVGKDKCRAASTLRYANLGDIVLLECKNIVTDAPCNGWNAGHTIQATIVDILSANGGSSSVANFAESSCAINNTDADWKALDAANTFIDENKEVATPILVPFAAAMVKVEVDNAAQTKLEKQTPVMGADEAWALYQSFDPVVELVNLDVDNTGNYIKGAALVAKSCSVEDGGRFMDCITPQGVGKALQSRIVVGGQFSSLLEGFDFAYHEPVIVRINSSAIDTRGWTSATPQSVQLYGAFFGSDESFQTYGEGQVLYGPGFQASCTVYNDSYFMYDSTLVQGARMDCAPVPGSGMNHRGP